MTDAVSADAFRRAITESPIPVVLLFAGAITQDFGAALDKAAETFGGSVRFASINMADNPALCRRFGLVAPTLIAFAHGAELARRNTTSLSVADLTAWLTPLVETGCGCDRCRG